MFSTFGPWDKEVKALINELSQYEQHSKTNSKENIENWFYNKGVLIFQDTHSHLYFRDIQACEGQYKHRPQMSGATMRGYKFDAFLKVRDEFFKWAFLFSDAKKEAIKKFNAFITETLSLHSEFCEIEAEVMNRCHRYLETYQISSESITEMIRKLFAEYKVSKSKLSEEIDAYISMDNELEVHRKRLPSTSSSSHVPTSFFIKLSAENIQNCNNITTLVDALIIKLGELTKPTFAKLEENVRDYKIFASNRHHGPELTDPHMSSVLRAHLLAAPRVLEKTQKKYQNVINALKQIKFTKTMTAEEHALLDGYKSEFESVNDLDSKTLMMFERIFKLVPCAATNNDYFDYL